MGTLYVVSRKKDEESKHKRIPLKLVHQHVSRISPYKAPVAEITQFEDEEPLLKFKKPQSKKIYLIIHQAKDVK